jgi:hypothetical protein
MKNLLTTIIIESIMSLQVEAKEIETIIGDSFPGIDFKFVPFVLPEKK